LKRLWHLGHDDVMYVRVPLHARTYHLLYMSSTLSRNTPAILQLQPRCAFLHPDCHLWWSFVVVGQGSPTSWGSS